MKSVLANVLEQYCSSRPYNKMQKTLILSRHRKASSESNQRASMSIYLKTQKNHFFMSTQSWLLQVFRSKYCTYRPDIKMARGSSHATGAKNTVSKYECSNIFQILRKPSPSYHIFFSGRVGQLAPPCTRIPLSSSCRRALRGTGTGGKPSTRLPPGTS